MNIQELLNYTIENNASDLHISSGHPPILRLYGELSALKVPALNSDTVREMLHSIMSDKQKKDLDENMELDFAIHFAKDRFRVNAFYTMNGITCVMRRIPTEILSLKDLNAPPIIESLTDLHKGLILVTGPTGSGKSTTVAAMINHINKNHYKHILTIEDPIEFVHKSDKSLINQREVGAQTKSFAKALKSALREDPDIILVGELRDIETIQAALTAAETGHLVIGTLHTSSAAQTIDRIIDVFPSEDKEMVRTMLSGSLEAVISQKLLRKADGTGRVCAFEIMTGIPAIRNLIREGKIPQINSLIQINSKYGMKVLKDSVYEFLDKRIITQETARIALNMTEMSESTNNSGNNSAPVSSGSNKGF
jgi:twitching motility protein PilT